MSRLHPDFLGPPIAHRGLHDPSRGIVENSMQAIKAAIDQGYGIEIDVQPSASKTPMVFHDYLMERLTGMSGPIRERPTLELQTIKLTGSSDTIPTLSEVLAEVNGQVPILIEVKDQDMRLGQDTGLFQEQIAETVAGYAGPMAIMSFNPHAIMQLGSGLPEAALGLVTDPFRAEDWPNVPEARRRELAGIPDAETIPVDFISHNKAALDQPSVGRLKAAGLPILCWTVRSSQDEMRARKVADNITFEGYQPARRA